MARRANAIAGGASGSDGVQSLTRGLTLLEKLAEAEGGITLTEISSRADVPPSTAHRLLNTWALRAPVKCWLAPVGYPTCTLNKSSVRHAQCSELRSRTHHHSLINPATRNHLRDGTHFSREAVIAVFA